MTGDSDNSVRARLLQQVHGKSQDHLCIGDIPATEIADRHGTPVYAFDADILKQSFGAVRTAFGPGVEILFALKANPNAAIAKILRGCGAGIEVASAGEILIAEHAGCPGKDMHFAGPGKRYDELRRAIELDIQLNVESEDEYQHIRALAEECEQRPRIALRVNPPSEMTGSRMRMAGGSKRFGIDLDACLPLVQSILTDDIAELRGLHVYAATQSFEASAWLDNAKQLFALATEIETATDHKLCSLNFGGGFGIPQYEGDPEFDLKRAGQGLQALIHADARPDREYHIELGRYLCGPAGVYLTRVLYLKTSQDRTHAVLDGGLHHHGAAAGMGSVMRRSFPLVLCRDLSPEDTQQYTIGGPLCTPLDELASDTALPELDDGDLIAVLSSGAYGLTYSPTMFLSHPTPAEILVNGTITTVIRDPGSDQDALRGQHLTDPNG